MYCVVAAEPGALEVIATNLQKKFPDWRFETAASPGELFALAGTRPDVVVVSRFLPGDPVEVLRRLPVEFPASHIVLLVGVLNEQAKAYVRQAAKYGLTNVVTGKLPGDRPYTIFAALTRARQELLEIQEGLEWEEEAPEASCGGRESIAAACSAQATREIHREVQLNQTDEGNRDALTGCYTRRYLENADLKCPFSVVLINLENLKPVNDILGHEAGDRVLAAFGKMLAENLKDRDLAVRWGGDEFVLILPETSPENAERVVERLREEWRKAVPGTGNLDGNLEVGFSYGISFNNGTEDLQATLRSADRAMYSRRQEAEQAPLLKKYYDSVYTRRSGGKLVLVAANKGGVGKTTVAISLSLLTARAGIPTCLCDFDFGGPNVAVFFDVKNKPGIEKLSGKRHVERFARELLVKVENNLMILPGPMNKTLPYFEPGQLAEIVDFLSQDCLVVGDTPPEFWTKPWMKELFQRADLVLAVVDQSKFSEAETKDYAPKLIMTGVEPSRIRIVCNRFSAKLYSVKRVESFFNAGIKAKKDLPRVVAAIPEDWEDFVKKGYRGEIAGLDDPASPWRKLAEEVARELGLPFTTRNEKQEKKSLFSLFRKR
ncbi:diguanylate cyclase [Desulfofundulus kuznetsovii DSM 6115]|uniref:Diguanylate cyclase n=1 Tax=Desulfofundulus kuznetsovii (strain DSM 6115 / VKM B-1805 / 17) TaxID=760568 RepID=A0AAU8PEN1_DESK7|nr:diguanylate cyclase [Desulfofundulus kuznetsovii DSM 6115]